METIYYLSGMITKKDQAIKWRLIESKQIPDDYTNAFLSHFGFHDEPLNANEEQRRQRILKSRKQ